MRLENVQNRPEYDENRPKNVENQANWTKNIQKVHKLQQKLYSQQSQQSMGVSLKILLLSKCHPFIDCVCQLEKDYFVKLMSVFDI